MFGVEESTDEVENANPIDATEPISEFRFSEQTQVFTENVIALANIEGGTPH